MRHFIPDRWLVFPAAALILYGLVMVASASIAVSAAKLHQPFYYFYHQLFYMMLGIVLAVVIFQVETSFWEKTGTVLLAGVMLLLALVLLPGLGHVVNGSARWVKIGPLAFQVSELAKLTVIIYMAGYLYRHPPETITAPLHFLKPLGLLGVVTVLLLKEPDFGAAAVILVTTLGMMFLAGMRLRYFLLIFLVVIAALSLLAVAAPYRMARLTGFLNPFADPYGAGYQLSQSLIAFGRGGWFGLGLGQGIQKLFYLPEAHTDFLFAVIAEELGLIGLFILIALFIMLIVRFFLIGRRAQLLDRHFAGLLAYGLGLWFAIQFIVSVGVNCGILPTKGLTLPLVSYGGSSMVVNFAALAFMLRIEYENRLAAR